MDSEKKMESSEGMIITEQFLNANANNSLTELLLSLEEDTDEEPVDNTQD